MNKIVSIILLCSLLILCFSGCSTPDNNDDGTLGKAPTELQSKDNELVLALIEYLQELFVNHDMPATSLAIKIDEIKNGKQPLHVGFDSSSYYFVCAYYNSTHEYETTDYCCVTEYTWVKFEGANEIKEYYNDAKFVVAFQINKASFVTDILSDEASVPNVEHFQIYEPNFNNGLNTNASVAFDKTFIYLNSSYKNNVYHSTSAYNNILLTLPCICLDEQYYITTELYTIYPDGERSDGDLVGDFGEYYDTLVNIMETGKYSVTDEKGRTNFYGLIRIEDIRSLNEQIMLTKWNKWVNNNDSDIKSIDVDKYTVQPLFSSFTPIRQVITINDEVKIKELIGILRGNDVSLEAFRFNEDEFADYLASRIGEQVIQIIFKDSLGEDIFGLCLYENGEIKVLEPKITSNGNKAYFVTYRVHFENTDNSIYESFEELLENSSV